MKPLRLPTAPSALLGAVALAVAPTSALAQTRVQPGNGGGADTHLFRPAVDSKGLFTVNGTETMPRLGLSLGLVTDYGHNLLRLEPGHGAKALVTHSFQGTFLASVGVFNRLTLGLQAPVVLMAGDEASDIGRRGATSDPGKLDAQGFGHVAAHAKLRLLRHDQVIGAAIVVQGGIPGTKSLPKDLGADAKPWFWPQLALEKSWGKTHPFRIAANGGYRANTTPDRTGIDQLKSGAYESQRALATYGAGVSLRVLETVDLVAETYGAQQLDGKSAKKTKLSQEVVGGVKLFVEKNSYLLLGGGVRVTDGFLAADQRGFIGFIFEPSLGDRDGDGIMDDEDKCPDEPEDKDGFEDEDGCPDPDNDKDGIPDSRDQCPNDPEDKDGFEDDDGCPEVNPKPKAVDGDRDGDGIPDSRDQCPDEPEDKDGFMDDDGCPDPDNDGDGIPDVRDKCPNEAETVNGFEDEDGCPDKGKVVIEGNDVVILEKIQFATGSAKILPQSTGILDAVAQTLKGHPEFQLLEIQGHADLRGAEQMNLRLTQDRANSVLDALLERGIEKTRLRAMGFGMYCPLDPARTPAAFEKNRRVEFKVLLNGGEKTNAELGCAAATAKGVVSPPVPGK